MRARRWLEQALRLEGFECEGRVIPAPEASARMVEIYYEVRRAARRFRNPDSSPEEKAKAVEFVVAWCGVNLTDF